MNLIYKSQNKANLLNKANFQNVSRASLLINRTYRTSGISFLNFLLGNPLQRSKVSFRHLIQSVLSKFLRKVKMSTGSLLKTNQSLEIKRILHFKAFFGNKTDLSQSLLKRVSWWTGRLRRISCCHLYQSRKSSKEFIHLHFTIWSENQLTQTPQSKNWHIKLNYWTVCFNRFSVASSRLKLVQFKTIAIPHQYCSSLRYLLMKKSVLLLRSMRRIKTIAISISIIEHFVMPKEESSNWSIRRRKTSTKMKRTT